MEVTRLLNAVGDLTIPYPFLLTIKIIDFIITFGAFYAQFTFILTDSSSFTGMYGSIYERI